MALRLASQPMSRTRQILFTVLRVATGVALLVYLGTSGAIKWRALGGLFRAWELAAAAFVILMMDSLLIAWRLKTLLSPRGLHLPLASAIRLTLIGIFFNSCLPGATGGDVIKIYYAAEGNKGRRTEVATLILLDRAVGMFALLLLPLLLAPLFPELIAASAGIRALLWIAGTVCAGLVAATLLGWLRAVRESALVTWVTAKLPFGKYLGIIYDTVYAYRAHAGTLVLTVAISLFAHLLAATVAMLCSLATHPQEFAWKMIVVIPLGFTASALPITPGGLGVGEAAFNRLFRLARLVGGAEALLGWRLLTLLQGLVGLAFYLQGRQRYIHDIAEVRNSSGSADLDAKKFAP
jgi:hypothetical protein